jgi:hypothetical protein
MGASMYFWMIQLEPYSCAARWASMSGRALKTSMPRPRFSAPGVAAHVEIEKQQL